jgi:uncharacterized membrane protein
MTKLRLALICSLVLNVIIISAIAGFLLNGTKRHQPRGEMGGDMRILFRELPAEFRKSVNDSFETQRRALKDDRDSLREVRRKIVAALEDPDFAADDLKTLLTEHANLLVGMQQASQSILVDAIAKMTPEQRIEYAKTLRRKGRKR